MNYCSVFEDRGPSYYGAIEYGQRASPQNAKNPAVQGFSHALEWTRTITGRKAHKALNLIRPE